MASQTERELDLIFDLSLAVYGGNMIAAEAALDRLRREGRADISKCIMRARKQAEPVADLPPLSAPYILPQPGHLPGSFEGSPRLGESG